MRRIKVVIVGVLLIFMFSCHQSDPPKDQIENSSGRIGDSIRFAGLDWRVKVYEDIKWGPGPNFFSGNNEDVFIDNNGYLHMKIVQRDGKWMSTEVVSDKNMSYGRYIFTIEGDFENIPENIVLGLFTWDDNTFFEQANSEVDIEISKWGDKNDSWTLQYGVQPINFGTFYPERRFRPEYELGQLTGVSTHAFTWTADKIVWESFEGNQYGVGKPIGSWTFDSNNPGRVKEEGGNNSKPIVIPEPGPTTNARINLWIATWINSAPTDGKEKEFIIRDFKYEVL